jgi:hypothetical protein
MLATPVDTGLTGKDGMHSQSLASYDRGKEISNVAGTHHFPAWRFQRPLHGYGYGHRGVGIMGVISSSCLS